MKILVTGATGFIGKALCQKLITARHSVCALVRKKSEFLARLNVRQILLSDLNDVAPSAIKDFDCLIYLAGRAHNLKDKVKDPLQEFRSVNVKLAKEITLLAINANVRQVIFISSIAVYSTFNIREVISENTQITPTTPYGLSKVEAEQALEAMCKRVNLPYVIIRPPLVYGANVPGNMKRLLNLVKNFPFLPFKNTQNLRSMISVDNLISVIENCIANPKAANQIFLVSDQQDLSTRDLIEEIALAMNKRVVFFSLPRVLMRLASRKIKVIDQLCGSLQIDSSLITRQLGWVPPYSPKEGIKKMIDAFKDGV